MHLRAGTIEKNEDCILAELPTKKRDDAQREHQTRSRAWVLSRLIHKPCAKIGLAPQETGTRETSLAQAGTQAMAWCSQAPSGAQIGGLVLADSQAVRQTVAKCTEDPKRCEDRERV